MTVEPYVGRADVNERADRQRPSWAKPLASLPEWLKKADRVMEETRERARPSPDREGSRVVFMRDLRDPRDIEWFFGLPDGSLGPTATPPTAASEFSRSLAIAADRESDRGASNSD